MLIPGPSRPGRSGHPGVAAAELAGQGVELADGGVHATELHRQRMRGVVARVHEQAVQQLVDGVVAADVDTHTGAFGRRVLGGAGHHLVERKLIDGLHRRQHLDDAGGAVPRMRVTGGDHVAGVEVGHQPRLGGDVAGNRRCAGRCDDSAAAHRVAADRLGRNRQRAGVGPRAFGTSEASTAGGVLTLYGQVSGCGPAFGSAWAAPDCPAGTVPLPGLGPTGNTGGTRSVGRHRVCRLGDGAGRWVEPRVAGGVHVAEITLRGRPTGLRAGGDSPARGGRFSHAARRQAIGRADCRR